MRINQSPGRELVKELGHRTVVTRDELAAVGRRVCAAVETAAVETAATRRRSRQRHQTGIFSDACLTDDVLNATVISDGRTGAAG